MASTPISPKVTAGANWAAYATLALTLLGNITPESLSFLGQWAPLVYGLVIAGTYSIGAYLKADPLREAGVAAVAAAAAPSAPVADVPAEPAVAAEVTPLVPGKHAA